MQRILQKEGKSPARLLERARQAVRHGLVLCVLTATVLCLVYAPAPLAAKSAPAKQPSGAEAPKDEKKKTEAEKPFVYIREGRPDPFMPFISVETIKAAKEKSKKKLTGMQLFEPGQLTLVAIVFVEQTPVAMVQDSAGKGYVIKKGTKIGVSGVVEKIIPNKVIIKQKTYTSRNRKRYRTVEMKLKTEGEK